MSTAWIALGMMLQSLQLSTGNFPKPLTEEEERYYVARSAEGDTAARNVLIERNLRLVAHIMKKYYASESDQEDLISIGTIGLIKAVNTYRPDKNIKLATYASRCIENAILTSARLSMRAARKQKTGNRLWSGLFPVSFLYGHNDRVQQLQLLPGRAVQIFQPLTDGPSVNL